MNFSESTGVTQPTELTPWLRLMLTEGVGNNTARKLLGAFGLPEHIFEQPTAELGQWVSQAQLNALRQIPKGLEQQLERCAQWLAHKPQARAIVTLADALYPKALLSLSDPPLILWLTGRIDWLKTHGWPAAISMVGSRNPSSQGDKNAYAFANSFAQSGLCVISGLALGIDAASHQGALNPTHASAPAPANNHLLTIAIVGTGLDRVYPKKNLELAHRIADQGLLLSEFPLGVPPTAANFPKRNRLIAALGLGTLVVEAALQSGSLITARETTDLGKDVFAIPGSIHAPQSKGCHALIKQGAKLVESAQDVLEELRINPTEKIPNPNANPDPSAKAGVQPNAPAPVMPIAPSVPATSVTPMTPVTPDTSEPLQKPSGTPHPILAIMGFDPISFDSLQTKLGENAASLQVQLLELELANTIQRIPGGLYQVVV